MAKRTVSCAVFGVVVAILCGLCVAVGLLVYFLACPEKSGGGGGTTSATTPTPTPTPPPAPYMRLPRSLRPSKYQLSVQPYFPSGSDIVYPPNRNFTFDGNVTITIECDEKTDNITLHMYKITLDNDSIQLLDVTDGQANAIDVASHSYDKKTQFVTFFLRSGTTLQPGHTYQLHLSYIGQLVAADLAGFYPSSYVEDGETKWLVATQFEPTDARRALPCFDEPSFKAVFEVKITHPSHMKAISNGMEEPSVDLGNGWNVTTFEPTLKMSSYLLAFAVCDFKSKSSYTEDGKVLFRVWARPSLIDEADYAVDAGPRVLDYYASYFNISFPLKKQDMLAIPDFSAGAMENWGLVVYRESALLYDDKVYASNNRQRVAVVIAHELSHQWFGDLVTMAWWDDLWLNEGFARYMEFVGTDVIARGAFHMDQQVVTNLESALRADQLLSSHPIFVPVSTPDEINAIFDDISYNKGAAVLRMLNYTISQPTFEKGLNIYLEAHKFSNANHNDLWAAQTEAVDGATKDWDGNPLNVSTFMNPWLVQMGYPVLNVKRSYGQQSPSASIVQERFLLTGNYSPNSKSKYDDTPFNYTWYVPLWYTSDGANTVDFAWLKPMQTVVIPTPADSKWLLVNYQAAGFYRVNYDDQNWRLLQKQLKDKNEVISIQNRAQLLDDVFNLARAGHLDYQLALDTTLYLYNETSFIPWQAAMYGFGYLEDMLVLQPEYQYFRAYMLGLMMPLYRLTGWDDSQEGVDDVLDHYRRVLAITVLCQLGYPDCLDHAKQLFTNSLAANCNSSDAVSSKCSQVPPNLRKVVYCAGSASGEQSWWNLLWNLHKKEQVAVEKDNLMYGLCCSRSPSLLTKLLDEAIDPNSTIVRRQDTRYVFNYIGANELGRVLLWEYFEDNWNKISAFAVGGLASSLGSALSAATRSFNTDFQAKMLDTFYRNYADKLGVAATAVKQQVEKVNANVDWVQKYQDDVVRWLQAHV